MRECTRAAVLPFSPPCPACYEWVILGVAVTTLIVNAIAAAAAVLALKGTARPARGRHTKAIRDKR